MGKLRKPAKRAKAGTGKDTAAARRSAFVTAYFANNENATRAAVVAGFSEKSAYQQGARLLKDVRVLAEIDARRAELASKAGLSLERTLLEISRLAYSDPRKMFNPDGSLKAIADLDDDTAATLASFETQEIESGDVVIGSLKKIKVWDKKGALDMAMRFHGGYKKDNEQQPAAVVVAVDDMELARRVAFVLSSADRKATHAHS